jgi:hypothetical protein
MAAKTTATAEQKEKFKARFAEIVSENPLIKDQYTIQFFETLQRSNYAINGKDGKSLNILLSLTEEEAEQYKVLKSSWQS